MKLKIFEEFEPRSQLITQGYNEKSFLTILTVFNTIFCCRSKIHKNVSRTFLYKLDFYYMQVIFKYSF